MGSDGETHQGIFDLSFLSSIPDMTVMAPKNKWELSDMIKFAIKLEAPVAIRYPRGNAYIGLEEFRAPVEYGVSEPIYEEKDILLYAVGSMVSTAEVVRDALKKKGLNCSLTNARFVKPLDRDYMIKAAADHQLIVTMEENVLTGGFGEQVLGVIEESPYSGKVKVMNVAIPDAYVEHGSVDMLKSQIGLDAESVIARVLAAIGKE